VSKRTTPKYIADEIENDHMIDFKKDTKLTVKQKEAVKLIMGNDITILTGPAGTAKTFCAAYAALKLFSKEDEYHKIIITKPTEIVSDADLGFLPGTLEEKLAAYMENFNDVFEDIVEGESLKMMVQAKEIQYKSVNYVRGRTIKNAIVIIDEFQNFDIKALMALGTRLGGRGAKMIFCGDIDQNDIHKKYVALNIFREIMNGLPSVAEFEFTEDDNMRHPLVQMMVKKFKELEAAGKIPQNKKNA
jgi:phosphate starvation-inducible PhoH-like protein